MLKVFALIFGSIFLLIGILGFIPRFTPQGELFGIFQVNGLHNFVHILSGIIFLIVGLKSRRASQIFFLIFGLVYLAVAILGFFYKDQAIFGLLSNNRADTYLHLVLSLLFLYFGIKGKA